MTVIFIADGFEEIETLTPADILRHAGLEVILCGVNTLNPTGRNGIKITCDTTLDNLDESKISSVIIPGGPGVDNLFADENFKQIIKNCAKKELLIGAICAASSILGRLGLLKGRRAVVFPGYEHTLDGAELTTQDVVKSGNIITAKAAGAGMDFALEMLEALTDGHTAKKIARSIFYS